MIQTIPIKQARANIADLVNQVDISGKQFIITKFGKPKAMLVATDTPKKRITKSMEKLPGFGMWKNRKDMKDSAKWVRDLRKQWSSRYDLSF